MAMLRYLADEDLDIRIVHGLRRVAPNIEFIRAQDAQLGSHKDDLILAHAADAGLIVVSHDVSTMTGAAVQRIERSEFTPGLIIVPQTLSIGKAVEDLTLLAAASEPDEWRDQILFLPL